MFFVYSEIVKDEHSGLGPGAPKFMFAVAYGFKMQMGILNRVLFCILQGYGLLALIFQALAPLRFLPAEDAVILFGYSRNLALHGAITYTAGGPHVEGATDFAWMVLLAGAEWCGVPAFWACAAFNAAALAGLGVVLALLAGVKVSAERVLAVAGSAALFRQIFAAASGFAVLPDALLMALLVLAVTRRQAAVAALLALAVCLFRPDGATFAVPLLAGLLWQTRGRDAWWVTTLFVVPGLAYFVWRWQYFGELLPLPFLVKSDFHRDLFMFVGGSVRASLVPLLFTAIVLTPVLMLGRRAQLWLVSVLIGLPTLFYWMVRLDQNVGSRFFYYLPTGTAILLALHRQVLGATRRMVLFQVTLAAWLVLLAAPLYREWLTFRFMQFGNVRSIAEALGSLPVRGRLLTSEAGFLPFYSGWASVDPWGLNTPEFAHRFFQASDVKKVGADLMVTHPDLSESCVVQPGWKMGYGDRSWPHMTRNLVEGASGSYALWLTPYGSDLYQKHRPLTSGQGDRECWFLRDGSPLQKVIEKILHEHGGLGGTQAFALEKNRKGLAP